MFAFAVAVAVVTAIVADEGAVVVAAADDDVVAAADTGPDAVALVGVGGIVDPVLLAIKLTSLAMESD